MKKVFSSFLVMLIITMGMACNKKAQTPEAVAEKFMKAAMAGDLEEAGKYCSPESIPMLNMAASMGALGNAESREIKTITCEVNETGDKAKCNILMLTDGVESNENLNLVMIDGEWKAFLSKEKD